jgi:putative phosphoribosyl transferase
VAKALDLPMDVWLVRKLGVPGQEELAMGAIALNGVRHINEDITRRLNIPEPLMNRIVTKEKLELERRNRLYRHGRAAPDVKGKTAIVIDDGLATGATMRAAIESLRQTQAGRIIAAVPVGAKDVCEALTAAADEVICPRTPEPFYGVGQWYEDFSQTGDEEVQALLARPSASGNLL